MEYLSVIEWNEILGTIDQPRLPGNSVGVDTKTACIAQFDGPCITSSITGDPSSQHETNVNVTSGVVLQRRHSQCFGFDKLLPLNAPLLKSQTLKTRF